jgi:hypothetical protein
MKLGMVFECITASAGLAAAEGDLETLTEQVLDGLLCNPAFTALTDANGNRLVEGFTELEIIERFDGSSDRHIGTAHIGLGVQYHQVFNPVLTTPLEEITLTTTDEFLSADLVFPQN